MSSTGLTFPDSNGSISADWSNPTTAYQDDEGSYTPVQIVAAAVDQISFKFTKDGGTNYGNTKQSSVLTYSNVTETIGSSTDTWGLTLSSSEVNDDTNFRVLIIGDDGDEHDFGFSGISVPSGSTINGIELKLGEASYDFGTLFFNYIQINIYYTLSGVSSIQGISTLQGINSITM